MPRVIWSHSSQRDLAGIDHFLSERDPAAASRILRAIRARVSVLERFPEIGPSLIEGYRYLSIRTTPYVIVYRLEAGRIEIARVRHVREDWFPAEETD